MKVGTLKLSISARENEMIKGAQARCLLAWYVGRKKLSWAGRPLGSAAYRTGQSCALNNAVSCLRGRKELSTGAHLATWHQTITEAGHPCYDDLMQKQMASHVGQNQSTWHAERLLAGQSCIAHTLNHSVSWHIGTRKFATMAYLATWPWTIGRSCCDRLTHTQMASHVWKKNQPTWHMEKLSNAAVPESNNRAGHLCPASCIDSQVSWYIQRNRFTTLNTARSTAAEPENIAGWPGPSNSQSMRVMNPLDHQTLMEPPTSSSCKTGNAYVSAEYAWPSLSTQPPFTSPKRSNFYDVVERVTRILSERPWGPPVIYDLNKLDVYMNSYHVVAILKMQSNTSVALGFFSWLKEKEGYKHNGFTYSKLFEILANSKEIHIVKALMQDVIKDKIDMIPNIFSMAARAYAHAGMLEDAVSAFNSMEEYGCKPDSHAYDIIIDILVKGGCPERAYAMYHKMLERGFFPKLYVCNLLVDSFWREERPDDALALFEKMKEKGEVPNMNTYNFLIKGLAKGGKADALCSVIGEMEDKGLKPNLTTYNTLIGVLVQAGEIDSAVQFLDHMVGSGVKPNNFTYSFLINGLGKVGKLQEAQILFRGLKELGGSPDDHVYNALVLNLSKTGKFTAAWEALQEMRSAGFKPSRSSYLALVASFKEADKPDLVRQVFDVMQNDDCAPHIVAYHDLIDKYSAGKNIDKACQVFEDMKKRSLPDVGTYNLMLKIHGRAKDLKKCKQIFSDMRKAGIEPSVVSYSTMIQTLGQSGCVKDAYNLFKEMRKKGCKPDAFAYGIILKAMVNAGQVEKAMSVFEEGKKSYKDLLMYSIMIDGFGKARKFKKAMGLLKEMKARGIQPDVVIFNSLIASLFKGDEREEAYELYRNMPKYGCEPNKRTKDIVKSLTKKAMTRRRK